jgi:Do/DeqQ family serine protease
MSAFRQLLHAKASNWAICLLSASLLAVAVSTWNRPVPASAQAGDSQPIRKMSGESKAVLNALEDAFGNIAESVEPSVVTITAKATPSDKPARPRSGGTDVQDVPEPFRDFFRRLPRPDGDMGDMSPRPSTGSGIIVRETGNMVYVLTNNHVVADRDRFTLQLFDQSEVPAELVGVDDRSDLAVLKFRARKPLPAGSVARLGDSDKVRVGQWAVAIGSPLGYQSTLTVGVISAKGRRLEDFDRSSLASYTDLLQTDASINPGNSGGPLVNIDGQVIGINVAIASSGMSRGSIGIGFAIPVNTAKMVSEQLITTGKVVRGYLGVSVSTPNRDLSQELKEHFKAPEGGALVEGVQADTPAGRAGVKEGDVIVQFGERKIHNFDDLETAVSVTRPGATIPVEVVRDGKPVRVSITVVQRPAEKELLGQLQGEKPMGNQAKPEQGTKSKFGLTVRPGEGGMEVVTVAPGSAADDAGMRPGYVITEVGRSRTPNLAEFQKVMGGIREADGVVLHVKTPAGLRFVVIKP